MDEATGTVGLPAGGGSPSPYYHNLFMSEGRSNVIERYGREKAPTRDVTVRFARASA